MTWSPGCVSSVVTVCATVMRSSIVTEAMPNFAANAQPSVVLPTPGAPPIKNTFIFFNRFPPDQRWLTYRLSCRTAVSDSLTILSRSKSEPGLPWKAHWSFRSTDSHKQPLQIGRILLNKSARQRNDVQRCPQNPAIVRSRGRLQRRMQGELALVANYRCFNKL